MCTMLRVMSMATGGTRAWRSGDAEIESVINVSMEQGRVVLRPVGQLDEEVIDTVLSLVAGARAAGAIAVVDLDHLDRVEGAGTEALHELTAPPSRASSSPA